MLKRNLLCLGQKRHRFPNFQKSPDRTRRPFERPLFRNNRTVRSTTQSGSTSPNGCFSQQRTFAEIRVMTELRTKQTVTMRLSSYRRGGRAIINLEKS